MMFQPGFLGAAAAPVGGGVPTFVALGTLVSGSSGTLSPGLPAGVAVDDIMIAFMVLGASSVEPSASGWTLLVTSPTFSAMGTWRSGMLWRRYQGGDTAPSISVDGVAGNIARIGAWRGANTGTAFEATSPTGNLGLASSYSYDQITTLGPNRLVLEFYGGRNLVTWTPGSGWIERLDSSASTSSDFSIKCDELAMAAAGTVPSGTTVASGTLANCNRIATALVPT